MNNAARRTKWKASPLLLLLTLIVCVLSQPMRARRSAFATSIAPAATEQAIACGQTLSGSITESGQQDTYNFNVRLSRNLNGRGEVDVAQTVNGKASNIVRVSVK